MWPKIRQIWLALNENQKGITTILRNLKETKNISRAENTHVKPDVDSSRLFYK